jgi:hypothetical protein
MTMWQNAPTAEKFNYNHMEEIQLADIQCAIRLDSSEFYGFDSVNEWRCGNIEELINDIPFKQKETQTEE